MTTCVFSRALPFGFGRAFSRLVLALAALACLLCRSAHAADFTIADGDVGQFNTAIVSSCSNNEDNTIHLAPGGTYTFQAVNNNDYGNSALQTIIANNGHSLTIEGNGATLQRSADCPPCRYLTIFGTVSVTIDNLTFQGGYADNGGGLYWANGGQPIVNTLTLNNCTFSNNQADHSGGGLYIADGYFILNNCVFTNNSCAAPNEGEGGGGFYYANGPNGNGPPRLTNCVFTDNTSSAIGGGFCNVQGLYLDKVVLTGCTFQRNNGPFSGGGVYFEFCGLDVSNCVFDSNNALGGGAGGGIVISCPYGGALFFTNVTNCIFSNNAAGLGGGLYNLGTTMTLTDSTFQGNNVNGPGDTGGGALANDGSLATILGPSKAVVTNCAFIQNSAPGGDPGGAVFTGFGVADMTMINCTFYQNSASYASTIFNAGGIGQTPGSVTLQNCTFSDNSLNDNSSTGYCIVNGDGGILSMKGVILQRNQEGWFSNDIFNDTRLNSTFTSLGYNLSNHDGSGLLNQPTDLINTDPMLGPMQNNGGPTFTCALLPGSPAIDCIPGTPGVDFPTTDQRGIARPQGAKADIGAFEAMVINQPPIANAGPDQNVTIPHDGDPNTNTIAVTLDGSASYDPEGGPLTYAWDDGQGDTATGSQPTLNLKAGTYAFTLTVTDNGSLTSTDTVTIVVNPEPNQPPTANSQSVSLNQDTNANITLTGSDPENDTLSFALASNPAHGTLSGAGANFTYTPNAGYVGIDSFTFQVTDAYGAVSNVATVSITVKDTTPPVITLNGSNPMTVPQGSVFTDPGATAVDNVDGNLPVTVSGSVNTAIPGSYTLTYSAQDSAGNKATMTRTVNVAAAPKVTLKLTSIGQLWQLVGIVVTINNGGSTTISNVKITSASLIGVNATLIVPNKGFSLGAGKSQEVGLAFFPLKKGQKGTLNITGSYSGGTFSLNQAVTIP
jgi:predicted outer membrane repeat protein